MSYAYAYLIHVVQPVLADEPLHEDCREQRVGGAGEVDRHKRPATNKFFQ
jgi:hypothetical protein